MPIIKKNPSQDCICTDECTCGNQVLDSPVSRRQRTRPNRADPVASAGGSRVSVNPYQPLNQWSSARQPSDVRSPDEEPKNEKSTKATDVCVLPGNSSEVVNISAFSAPFPYQQSGPQGNLQGLLVSLKRAIETSLAGLDGVAHELLKSFLSVEGSFLAFCDALHLDTSTTWVEAAKLVQKRLQSLKETILNAPAPILPAQTNQPMSAFLREKFLSVALFLIGLFNEFDSVLKCLEAIKSVSPSVKIDKMVADLRKSIPSELSRSHLFYSKYQHVFQDMCFYSAVVPGQRYTFQRVHQLLSSVKCHQDPMAVAVVLMMLHLVLRQKTNLLNEMPEIIASHKNLYQRTAMLLSWFYLLLGDQSFVMSDITATEGNFREILAVLSRSVRQEEYHYVTGYALAIGMLEKAVTPIKPVRCGNVSSPSGESLPALGPEIKPAFLEALGITFSDLAAPPTEEGIRQADPVFTGHSIIGWLEKCLNQLTEKHTRLVAKTINPSEGNIKLSILATLAGIIVGQLVKTDSDADLARRPRVQAIVTIFRTIFGRSELVLKISGESVLAVNWFLGPDNVSVGETVTKILDTDLHCRFFANYWNFVCLVRFQGSILHSKSDDYVLSCFADYCKTLSDPVILFSASICLAQRLGKLPGAEVTRDYCIKRLLIDIVVLFGDVGQSLVESYENCPEEVDLGTHLVGVFRGTRVIADNYGRYPTTLVPEGTLAEAVQRALLVQIPKMDDANLTATNDLASVLLPPGQEEIFDDEEITHDFFLDNQGKIIVGAGQLFAPFNQKIEASNAPALLESVVKLLRTMTVAVENAQDHPEVHGWTLGMVASIIEILVTRVSCRTPTDRFVCLQLLNSFPAILALIATREFSSTDRELTRYPTLGKIEMRLSEILLCLLELSPTNPTLTHLFSGKGFSRRIEASAVETIMNHQLDLARKNRHQECVEALFSLAGLPDGPLRSAIVSQTELDLSVFPEADHIQALLEVVSIGDSTKSVRISLDLAIENHNAGKFQAASSNLRDAILAIRALRELYSSYRSETGVIDLDAYRGDQADRVDQWIAEWNFLVSHHDRLSTTIVPEIVGETLGGLADLLPAPEAYQIAEALQSAQDQRKSMCQDLLHVKDDIKATKKMISELDPINLPSATLPSDKSIEPLIDAFFKAPNEKSLATLRNALLTEVSRVVKPLSKTNGDYSVRRKAFELVLSSQGVVLNDSQLEALRSNHLDPNHLKSGAEEILKRATVCARLSDLRDSFLSSDLPESVAEALSFVSNPENEDHENFVSARVIVDEHVRSCQRAYLAESRIVVLEMWNEAMNALLSFCDKHNQVVAQLMAVRKTQIDFLQTSLAALKERYAKVVLTCGVSSSIDRTSLDDALGKASTLDLSSYPAYLSVVACLPVPSRFAGLISDVYNGFGTEDPYKAQALVSAHALLRAMDIAANPMDAPVRVVFGFYSLLNTVLFMGGYVQSRAPRRGSNEVPERVLTPVWLASQQRVDGEMVYVQGIKDVAPSTGRVARYPGQYSEILRICPNSSSHASFLKMLVTGEEEPVVIKNLIDSLVNNTLAELGAEPLYLLEGKLTSARNARTTNGSVPTSLASTVDHVSSAFYDALVHSYALVSLPASVPLSKEDLVPVIEIDGDAMRVKYAPFATCSIEGEELPSTFHGSITSVVDAFHRSLSEAVRSGRFSAPLAELPSDADVFLTACHGVLTKFSTAVREGYWTSNKNRQAILLPATPQQVGSHLLAYFRRSSTNLISALSDGRFCLPFSAPCLDYSIRAFSHVYASLAEQVAIVASSEEIPEELQGGLAQGAHQLIEDSKRVVYNGAVSHYELLVTRLRRCGVNGTIDQINVPAILEAYQNIFREMPVRDLGKIIRQAMGLTGTEWSEFNRMIAQNPIAHPGFAQAVASFSLDRSRFRKLATVFWKSVRPAEVENPTFVEAIISPVKTICDKFRGVERVFYFLSTLVVVYRGLVSEALTSSDSARIFATLAAPDQLYPFTDFVVSSSPSEQDIKEAARRATDLMREELESCRDPAEWYDQIISAMNGSDASTQDSNTTYTASSLLARIATGEYTGFAAVLVRVLGNIASWMDNASVRLSSLGIPSNPGVVDLWQAELYDIVGWFLNQPRNHNENLSAYLRRILGGPIHVNGKSLPNPEPGLDDKLAVLFGKILRVTGALAFCNGKRASMKPLVEELLGLFLRRSIDSIRQATSWSVDLQRQVRADNGLFVVQRLLTSYFSVFNGSFFAGFRAKAQSALSRPEKKRVESVIRQEYTARITALAAEAKNPEADINKIRQKALPSMHVVRALLRVDATELRTSDLQIFNRDLSTAITSIAKLEVEINAKDSEGFSVAPATIKLLRRLKKSELAKLEAHRVVTKKVLNSRTQAH